MERRGLRRDLYFSVLLFCAGEADSMRGNVAAVPLPEESSEVPERFPILPCWTCWIVDFGIV